MTSRLVPRRAALYLPALLARPARAAEVLNRPARLIVGAAAGSGTDPAARLLARYLVGYAPSVLVENRPGASTRLALEAVKNASPDGTTFLQTPMPVLTLFPHVFPKTTRYNPVTDFEAVGTLGEIAYGFVVPTAHPARDLAGFIAWAKQKGDCTFAPPVLGAPQHMMGLAFAREAGFSMTVVAYSRAPNEDLLAGRIDSFMSHMAAVATLLETGGARMLAVTSARRLPQHPAVPTFAEQGYPNFTATEAMCWMLPAHTPAPLVAALNGALARAVALPEVREGLSRLSLEPLVLSPAATAERIREESARWVPVVRASGFTAEE